MPEKFAQSSVDYRDGTARRKCAVCRYFRAPEGCSKVKGKIRPDGVCDLFAAKDQDAE